LSLPALGKSIISKKTQTKFISFNSEPTTKAMSRMPNSNSSTQADDSSERANQMIMVSILVL
jgi:hypothetical protein